METKAARLAALGAAAAAAGLWLSLPDKTFVFDGVIFAQVVERAVDEWRAELLNPRHLLFNPFFMLLRDALAAAGVETGAYRLFQAVNALAGAAGLLLFLDLARRLSRDAVVAAAAALLLGATWTYGTRATEGQAYMLMSLGALATLWSCVRLVEAPSAGRAAAAAACFAAGAAFHAADLFLFPAVAGAFWTAWPRRRAAALAGAAGAAALVGVPYLLAFRHEGLRGFAASAADFHGGGGGFWGALAERFWTGGGLGPAGRAVLVWRETGLALTPMPAPAALAAGLALWAAALAGTASAWRGLDAARRGGALAVLLAWAGFTAVNAFWPGGLFFYVPPLACALALAALAAGPALGRPAPRTRRGVLGVVFGAALALGAWNVRAHLVPQSRLESNAGYRQAMYVGAHTVPSSWIVITGLGFSNAKAYLPGFARRTREVLEFYFSRAPKEAALAEISAFVRRQTAHGIPIYFLSDLAEGGAEADMRRLWGVELGDVQQAFGPGRVVRVAASPLERVYLFVPRDRQPELFAVLGFSVLGESDMTLVSESAVALKEIAAEMSPAERRRAAELMRTRNWGFDMLWEGFSPYMSPESRAATKERLARFAEYQKTADFWLRTGNLYKFLGLKGDAIAAWSRAQKISGDASLLKDIEAYRKSR